MMARQIVATLISFGMAIAFANLVSKDVYGSYKYVLSIATLLAIPTLSGINTSLVRAVSQGFEGTVPKALYTRLSWGVFGGLGALTIAFYYWIQSNFELSLIFFVIATLVPLKSSFSVYQSFWQGKKRFSMFSKLAILQDVIASVPLLITLFLSQSLLVIVFVYFFSQTVASVSMYLYTLRHISKAGYDHHSLTLGKHISLSNVLFTISNNATDIILFHFLGPASVAMFAFATRPPRELKRIFTESFPIALPKFSQRSKEEIQDTLLKKIGMLYVILIPATIFYIVVAPFVFKFAFPAYLDVVRYSQLYSISILFAPLPLFGIAFQALGKIKEMYILSLVSPSFFILAMLILVPPFGVLGAVTASLASLVFGMMATLYLFKRM